MTQEERPVRVIKRYSNRKLYDLTESRYITLQDVASFLQSGYEVQIVDKKTNKDITSVTLAQVLLEQERKQSGGMPVNLLRNILSNGEQLFQKRLATPVRVIKGEAEKNIQGLKDETERRVSFLRAQAERSLQRLLDNSREMGEDARSAMVDFTHTTQVAIDDLSHQVDDRFRQLLSFVRHQEAGTSDLDSLSVRLLSMEEELRKLAHRVEVLERRLK